MLLIMTLLLSTTTLWAAPSKPLVFSDPGWDSVKLHNAVAMYIIETLYDVPSRTIMGTTPITWQAVLNGEIDIQMETWAENIASYEEDIQEGRALALSVNFDDNAQGLYVPAYVIYGDAERGIEPMAPDLKTVKDLKNYPELFIEEGRPRIYGAISGWAADEILSKKYVAYGLDQYYNYFQPGSDAALTSSFVSAYERGEPWVGYSWEPTWMSGKYDIVLLEDAPYEHSLFLEGLTAYPANTVVINTRAGFDSDYPEITAFLSNYQTSSALTAKALAYMEDHEASIEETARWFIVNHPELLEEWVGKDDAKIVLDALGEAGAYTVQSSLFSGVIPVIDRFVKTLSVEWSGFFDRIKSGISNVLQGTTFVLGLMPWWLAILGIILLGYLATHKKVSALSYGVMMFFIYGFGFWEMMLSTLSVVIVSVIISLVLGIPLGILIASSKRLDKILHPILDGMQTMPAFVYLIPAVMFFGLGMVPATLATTIYSLPPIVRLTSLGIQKVDKEMREASKAFGSTKMQTLAKVELPQALPTIMAGVNQTTMMSVAMVVTCSMIGAEGIGIEVLTAINRIEVGRGFVAGIAIVFIAIIIDRILQGFTKITQEKSLRGNH